MFPFSSIPDLAKTRLHQVSQQKLHEFVHGQNASGKDGPVLRQVVLIQNLLQSTESLKLETHQQEDVAASIRRDEELWLDQILDECLEGDEEYVNIRRVEFEYDYEMSTTDTGFIEEPPDHENHHHHDDQHPSTSVSTNTSASSSIICTSVPSLVMTYGDEDEDDLVEDDSPTASPTQYKIPDYIFLRSPHPQTISLYFPARNRHETIEDHSQTPLEEEAGYEPRPIYTVGCASTSPSPTRLEDYSTPLSMGLGSMKYTSESN